MNKSDNSSVYFLCIIISFVVTIFVNYFVINGIIDKFISHNNDTLLKITEVEQIIKSKYYATVTVTAYSPTVRETDSTPYTNAAMERVKEGTVAVSRDLLKAGWGFNKKVWIENVGVFIIKDLMNPRWKKRIDIFMHSTKKAEDFGIEEKRLAILFAT